MRLPDDRGVLAQFPNGPKRVLRHWRGRSGRDYALRVMPMERVRAGETAVVVLAEKMSNGAYQAAWIGRADAPDFRVARAAYRGWGRCEAHVHIPADHSTADDIVRDLRTASEDR